ncbi:MAG TPA: ATP-binding SpoIIE family protein phosphatase [Stellaceae bacterium]|jgi:anti-sigma regulatory factor (Ser/Thr protein kinase)|nr:ATP-binding SpoIIE family protein phosphatase [Stellaceae bacterium]
MISVPVTETSQVGEARRAAAQIAKQQGFGDADIGRVALVVTELASNLVKHGGGGEILAGWSGNGGSVGIDILALDHGHGIADIGASLADGYSSSGTRGQGLGAVRRLSQIFDILSWPQLGTAILARIEPGQPQPARAPPQTPPQAAWIGAVDVAKSGEDVSGDAWSAVHTNDSWTVLVADGLGHGPIAAEASAAAVRIFSQISTQPLPALLDDLHAGLRATRGAAISAARFDGAAGKVIFAGIGNVAGVLFTNGEARRMVSMPGTVGYVARKIQAFEYPFRSGLMILHSDGLSTNWTLARYPGVSAAHPTLIAAVLYRDFGRRRDDATVVVGKWPSS